MFQVWNMPKLKRHFKQDPSSFSKIFFFNFPTALYSLKKCHHFWKTESKKSSLHFTACIQHVNLQYFTLPWKHLSRLKNISSIPILVYYLTWLTDTNMEVKYLWPLPTSNPTYSWNLFSYPQSIYKAHAWFSLMNDLIKM